MLIKEKLENLKFTNSEQIIVDYLLKEQLNIQYKSTSQIAKETYSSKSTIVKVAQRLHFNGWSDFKEAYLNELKYWENHHFEIDANYPFTKQDNLLKVAQKIALLEQSAIEDTCSLLDYATLKQAVSIIQKATYTHLFALSNNLLISQEFKYNMARIKKRVDVHTVQGEAMFEATLANKEECAIIISYSGETETIVKIAQLLHRKQVPMIVITNIGESSISKLAQCVLKMSTRERLYSKIATYANDASITYLLDVLYSCIFQLDYEKNSELRRDTSMIFEASRHTNFSLLKEK
ncbi:MurR/RpiR family transcriptional regulator [Carnobacteriaceae bacterium zg-ZUI78]|uniref:MurR/RpiR family transcriptional regulator n=1 Tax=Granulicatella sp. zg-84 TaxID=2678503 RepID=UPI0013C242E5|nr:MurR/RpiR family transcriptional regulator [Granulicatella sp. zg-84]MBS4750728.1 MurR/RpiR family transcriptional regulator [Carnobacteriaceae bacterium zg-ZUI78]NEW66478.1 SIS domain-containing protein [Granulicatella sp. zg-84]QMI86021.1 MurR/RpiR family transcriptional regulator [Carnobacteriaceae bacterium zg-84]